MDMFEISSKNMTEKKEMSESDLPKTGTISDKGANISYEPGPEQRVRLLRLAPGSTTE